MEQIRYTPDELANKFGINKNAFQRFIHEGRIKLDKDGMITENVLNSFIHNLLKPNNF
jgi:hypothetical protein